MASAQQIDDSGAQRGAFFAENNSATNIHNRY